MGGQQHFPAALTPEKGPVRIILEVGGGGGGSWPVCTTWKISPSQRFDPRNVHAIASLYTNLRDKGNLFRFIQDNQLIHLQTGHFFFPLRSL